MPAGDLPLPTDRNVTVVIATRNRRESALSALTEISRLPERPPIVLVDNASTDGTPDAVRGRHPSVHVIRLTRNQGAAGRNVGVRRARTPYVALSDDDSWWAPGSLRRAASLMDAHPRLAVVAGRILVGSEERLDPTCVAMARSPLRHRSPAIREPAVLGFVACGAVVRRKAFLQVGGFLPRFGIGGEEELLSVDLAAAGWDLCYAEDVVAHHHPSPLRDRKRRLRTTTRNALWAAWLRRPGLAALRRTGGLLRKPDRTTLAALGDALLGLPWVLRSRRVIPREVQASLTLLTR